MASPRLELVTMQVPVNLTLRRKIEDQENLDGVIGKSARQSTGHCPPLPWEIIGPGRKRGKAGGRRSYLAEQ